MLRNDVLSALYQKRKTVAEFNWDALFVPSMYCFMSEVEIEKLYNIATSIKYAGDIRKKDLGIKSVLEPLGFRRLASGTNRVVYTYLEDTRFLIKIAVDKTGMKNTPDEFKNQMFLRPFVTKCFESHPTGIIGSFERIQPITNIEEFVSVWDDVFEAILNLIGEYIIEDIGTSFFMNWGIRSDFGPVLCDYPEMFKLDGNKLFCNRPVVPGQKFPLCGGTIDYDEGFNYLVCTHCGKQYTARELSKGIENKLIVMKGDVDMDVQLVRGNNVIVDGRDYGTATIRPPKKKFNKELGVTFGKASQMTEQPLMDTTNLIMQLAQSMQDGKNIDIPKTEDETPEGSVSLPEEVIQPESNISIETKPEGAIDIEVKPVEETTASDKSKLVEINPRKAFDHYKNLANSSADDEEDTELPQTEQSNNRVKPIPPSGGVLDLY